MLEGIAVRNTVRLERVQEETWDADHTRIVGARLLVSIHRLLTRSVQGHPGRLGHSPPGPQLNLHLLHGQVPSLPFLDPFLSHVSHRCHNPGRSGEVITSKYHCKLLREKQKDRSTCRVYELTLPSGAPGPEWAPSPVGRPLVTDGSTCC